MDTLTVEGYSGYEDGIKKMPSRLDHGLREFFGFQPEFSRVLSSELIIPVSPFVHTENSRIFGNVRGKYICPLTSWCEPASFAAAPS